MTSATQTIADLLAPLADTDEAKISLREIAAAFGMAEAVAMIQRAEDTIMPGLREAAREGQIDQAKLCDLVSAVNVLGFAFMRVAEYIEAFVTKPNIATLEAEHGTLETRLASIFHESAHVS